ncbi:MAG: response regulator transcription factor [Lentisphaeraceae bacterium]|nr:response regulator transcription factor [Lentisphaeraceae bacterium]
MSELINVWLIEDSEIYRRGLMRSLERAEEITCTEQFISAEPAIDKLTNGESVDVILLDIGLPGMSGLEALKQIREINPETCVVILTVFDDTDKIFKAVCNGARGYLLKTSPIDTVVGAVVQAYEGGAPMTPGVASCVLKLFSDFAGKKAHGENDYGLTPREYDVLELLTQSLAGKEIADRLCVSSHTVTSHLRSIYSKLHVTTKTGAVVKALREGLI